MARSMNNFFTLCICAIAAIILGQDAAAFTPSSSNVHSVTSSVRQLSPFTASPFIENGSRTKSASSSSLSMSEKNESSSNLPVFLDPGTKGGAVVLSLILFIIPIIIYQVATGVFGVDEIEAGRDIGVGFSVITMLLWGSTYIFRVATKDMTYAKQLKDYEDAVIAKRLEELDEDEVQALVEDIEREQF
ncbi:hypothetical protein ACHAXM_009888 [Skeletonema potamos]